MERCLSPDGAIVSSAVDFGRLVSTFVKRAFITEEMTISDGAAPSTTVSSCDYHPAADLENGGGGDNGGATDGRQDLVGSILLYRAFPHVYNEVEMNLEDFNCVDKSGRIPPLVWGGLFYATYSSMQERHSWDWSGFIFWMSYMFLMLDGDDSRTITFRGNNLNGILFLIAFGSSILLRWYLQRRMAQNIQTKLADEVNPTLSTMGYRAEYRVEATGECYSKEHRIYVFSLNPSSRLQAETTEELLQRLPAPKAASIAVPQDPVTVYLHAPPYQCLAWDMTCAWPPFFEDGIPATLENRLHPFLWGALHSSVHLHCRMRSYLTFISFSTLVLIFLVLKGAFGGAILWGLAVFLYAWVSEIYFNNKACGKGHPLWAHAVHRWKAVFVEQGWQLEYNHGSLEAICCTSPDFFVRFVPLTQS